MKKEDSSLIYILKQSAILLVWLFAAYVLLNYSYFMQQASYYAKNHRFFSTERAETNQAKDTPDHLSIPKLGIEAPLRYPTETDETIFQMELASGVVHYPNTAMPGQFGNAYYFGHSSDYYNKPGEYKTVFALLPKIKPGDEIFISDAEGVVYKYVVEETRVVRPNQAQEVLDQMDNKVRMLTLQTSYPVGTAISRFIARASLVE